jgi:hypothetical protein
VEIKAKSLAGFLLQVRALLNQKILGGEDFKRNPCKFLEKVISWDIIVARNI